MPTRFFAMIFTATLIVIFTAPVTCGHNFKKGPMKKGCRKVFVKWIYKFFSTIYIGLAGMLTSKVTQDCDYSYYLGPNYKDNYKQIVRTSTIVPNHAGWLDSVIMIKYFCPSFAPKILF
jgi:1-acyl-sn-glycerol-3-phosphate acyltransferase